MRGNHESQECAVSLSVLFEVLLTITALMAPFTPMMSEYIYQSLRQALPDGEALTLLLARKDCSNSHHEVFLYASVLTQASFSYDNEQSHRMSCNYRPSKEGCLYSFPDATATRHEFDLPKSREVCGSVAGRPLPHERVCSDPWCKLSTCPASTNLWASVMISVLQTVVVLGRQLRERRKVTMKTPVAKISVILGEIELCQSLVLLEQYIKEELNALEIVCRAEKDRIQLSALPNLKLLGAKYGKDLKTLGPAIKALRHEELVSLEKGDALTVMGKDILLEDVILSRAPTGVHEDEVTGVECNR